MPRARGARVLPRPLVRGPVPPRRRHRRRPAPSSTRFRAEIDGWVGVARRPPAAAPSRLPAAAGSDRRRGDRARPPVVRRLARSARLHLARACAGSPTTPAATTSASALADTSAWAGRVLLRVAAGPARRRAPAGGHLARRQRRARRPPRRQARRAPPPRAHRGRCPDRGQPGRGGRPGARRCGRAPRPPRHRRHPRLHRPPRGAPLRDGVRAVPAIDRGAWAVANLHLDSRLARPPRRRRAGVGQRPLRQPEPRLRRRHPPARPRPRPHRLDLVLPLHRRRRGGARPARRRHPRRVGRGRARRSRRAPTPICAAAVAASTSVTGATACCGRGSARCSIRRASPPAPPIGPIHFAHSDLSGIALFEEAFDHGVRAADEVQAALAEGT